jgi:glyoxylase-like metal-dependent hydrolase (beta-lactamase superfamily II)
MNVPSLTIGRATVHFLNDGFWWDDGGAMFGVVPKELWSREKTASARNRIRMSLVCPLIIADGEVTLVDTGIGTRLSERERIIYDFARPNGIDAGLGLLGIERSDVTTVVLSHLHFDHCGGVIRGTAGGSALAFPRARHLIQRREWEVAMRPTNERLAAAYRHAPECLGVLTGDRLHLLDGATAVSASVRTLVSGGHTPTHQCAIIESAGAGLVHLADLAPTTSHLRPAWTMAYDVDPLETVEAKRRLLAEVTTKNWWVSLDHDDRVASGRFVVGGKVPALSDVIATPTYPGT